MEEVTKVVQIGGPVVGSETGGGDVQEGGPVDKTPPAHGEPLTPTPETSGPEAGEPQPPVPPETKKTEEDTRICSATVFIPGLYDRPSMAVHKEYSGVRMASVDLFLGGVGFRDRDGRSVIVSGVPVIFEQE